EAVRVAPYATFGTPELAVATAAALGGDNCILMANHGLLAVGPELEAAYLAALHVEEVARLCFQARCLGEPVCLNKEEMAAARERFADYGRRREKTRA
ncbi:MAG: class II aldolase/adducin family protein, partial [Deltaproteobacteria bacterium]|nr:class II aldolase/adducin family protein [Deltaproteobacteria bacterium]